MKDRISLLLQRLDKKLTAEYLSEGPVNPSVTDGHTGVAMFYAYYYLLTKDERHRENCRALVARVIDHIAENEVKFTLAYGLAGVGICLQHLAEIGILEDEDILEDLDGVVYQSAMAHAGMYNYDLLHGAIGMGLYLFLRGERNNKNLSDLINILDEKSHKTREGQFWIDFVTLNPDAIQRVNFGLAHGIPSMIGFAARLVQKNISIETSLSVLKNTLKYFLVNSNVNSDDFRCFPSSHLPWLESSATTSPVRDATRLAWCYGDLGISFALLDASKALNDRQLAALAQRSFRNSLRWKSAYDTQIIDGSLCHGYASAAHLYNRLYINTADKAFGDAADHWANETILFADRCGGIDKFTSHYGLTNTDEPTTNFLMGSTGAGIALISILDRSIVPGWDRLLMLS